MTATLEHDTHHHTITPTQLVIALLRTLTDVQQSWDPRSGGDGARLMPRAYHEGSYQELERCLRHMRHHHRPMWWHVSHRYRWGIERWAIIGYHRTRQGPIPHPPNRHSEVVIVGGTLPRHTMRAKLYEWDPDVDPDTVDQGVRWIVSSMHRGNTGRIKVPAELLAHLMGVARAA